MPLRVINMFMNLFNSLIKYFTYTVKTSRTHRLFEIFIKTLSLFEPVRTKKLPSQLLSPTLLSLSAQIPNMQTGNSV